MNSYHILVMFSVMAGLCVGGLALLSNCNLTGLAYAQLIIDLDQVNGDVRILGDDEHNRLGSSVASGDINGDGTDDLIIGAPNLPDGVSAGGEVYVIYGGSLADTIDLNYRSADLIVRCNGDNDGLGRSVASGDINGDGIDDLIIGAPFASPMGRVSAGVVYLVSGGENIPDTIDLRSSPADFTVYGGDDGDRLGSSVFSGDINGDGINDLIIGAPFASSPGRASAGVTYVVYGGKDLPDTLDLGSNSPGLTVYGDDANDWSGWSVSSGDLNGDGTDDLIIGAHKANPAGRVDAGKTYVICGGPNLPSVINLKLTDPDLIVCGDDIWDQSGYSVSSGDINGDGTDDLIIGARLASPLGHSNAGETYVIYGRSDLPLIIDLDSADADLTIYGDDADDQLGYAVSSGNLNSDDIDDLIIGAPGLFPSSLKKRGKTYVIYGGSFPNTIDLDSDSADLTVYGDDGNDASGCSVSGGDLNGDGTDDLIIGAEGAFPAGEAYVIYGSKATDVADRSDQKVLPEEFVLKQNYPNPFTLSTIIKYGLSKETDVTIKVYDIIGQEVKTLTDGHQERGLHAVCWDGRNSTDRQVARGIYLYVLSVHSSSGYPSDFTQVRKMLLLR